VIVANVLAVVLCRNPPKRDPTPPTADHVVTDPLAAAGRLLDIPFTSM
jgi:DNA repair protein RadC